MPTLQRNDISTYYEVIGVGPPIVLGHSFLSSGEMWSPQIAPLASEHRVINVDLRGHGRSGPISHPFDMYDLVDDVLAVLDQEGVDRATWAGLSIGGMVALRAALVAKDRVSSLILLDTHAGPESAYNKLKYSAMLAAARVVGTAPLMGEVVRMFFCSHTRKIKPDLVEGWKARFASVPIASIMHTVGALKGRDSIVGRLPEIHVPALVIVGADDSVLPDTYSKEIAHGLSNASLLTIEKSGHLPTLEQPDIVTSAMLRFLAGEMGR